MTTVGPFLIASMVVAARDGAAGAGSLPVVIGTAAVVVIVLTRVRGRELRPRRLLVLPLVLLVLGIAAVVPQLLGQVHLHGIDYVIAGLDLVLSFGLGAARGFAVRISFRDDKVWYRYGAVTVLLWCLSIALRFALGVYGSHHGATALVTSASVIFMLGLTLLTQNVIVRRRQSVRSQRQSHEEPDAAGERSA